MIIYKIQNKINQKIYIGQTERTLEERKSEHIRLSKNPNYEIHEDIKIYGVENFTFDLCENVTLENINEKERYWIKYYNSYKNGYNMTTGGKGVKGFHFTDETKKIMSDKKLGSNNSFFGKTHTVESKQRIGECVKKTRYKYKPFLGKTHTEVSKQKTREKLSNLFEIQFPDGSKKIIKGLREFCKERGIHASNLLQNKNGTKGYRILKKIESNNRIFARKCYLKVVDSSLVKGFLDENHLQGYIPSKVNLALFHEDYGMVFVMTFSKPRFNKKYEWELIRLCSKKNFIIVGGASKCFNFFLKEFHPNTIISYCDKKYFTGEIYNILKFTYSHDSLPNYWWVRGEERYNRVVCQKHKLKSLLKDGFDESKSETENMISNGFKKEYDLGNSVFVYHNYFV